MLYTQSNFKPFDSCSEAFTAVSLLDFHGDNACVMYVLYIYLFIDRARYG
jgi:hypothetical protein